MGCSWEGGGDGEGEKWMALEKMRGQNEQKKEGSDGRRDRLLPEVLSWVKGGITTRGHGRPTIGGGRMKVIFILVMSSFWCQQAIQQTFRTGAQVGGMEGSQASCLEPLEQVNIEQREDTEREEETRPRQRLGDLLGQASGGEELPKLKLRPAWQSQCCGSSESVGQVTCAECR